MSHGFQRLNCVLTAAVMAAALLLFTAPVLEAQKKEAKPEAAGMTDAELEAAYRETEELVKAGSTDSRPGLRPWNQVQGADLVWPAKYYLPWPAGVSHKVYQGWNGNKLGPPRATHMQAQNYYAWDFNIVRGEAICAARDGEVSHCDDTAAAGRENDNTIRIKHIDGEESVYAHIGSGTATVKLGDKVLAGQKICEGSHESQHLHFVIWKNLIDYPCRFLDYAATNGIPQYGTSPTSGNKGTPADVIEKIKQDFQKGEQAYAAGNHAEALKHFRSATQREVLIEEYEKALARIGECRAAMEKEVSAAIEEARKGDYAGADKRFKELKKKYGDKEAQDRIDAALLELRSDPKFKAWAAKQMAQRKWAEARQAEEREDFARAIRLYRELLKVYAKEDPEYKELRKKIQDLEMARGIED